MLRTRHPILDLASELATFALLAASIILLYRHNTLLSGVLLLQALIVLRRWDDPLEHGSFWVTAVLGTAAELVFVHYGIWRYANPSLWGVPLWFPVSFGIAGLIGQRTTRTMVRLRRGRSAGDIPEPRKHTS